jgi:DNA repair protein RadC
MYARLPWPLSLFGRDLTRFHPGLAAVLRREPGAAAAFRGWARALIERATSLQNLCAAHTSALLARDNPGPSIAARIEDALRRAESTLRAHERAHG